MRGACIKFGEPDLDSQDCRDCWKDVPELFFSCIKAEYQQIAPQRATKRSRTLESLAKEMDKADKEGV